VLPRLRPLAVFVAAVPLLAGCGGGATAEDDSLPPLTPEPSLSVPGAETTPPAPRPGSRASYPARLVLMKFLRGVGEGDARVCGHLSPAYARATFAGVGGCPKWIGATSDRLTPEELGSLQDVQVIGATPGPRAGQYTIGLRDLKWDEGAAAPEGVVAQRYVVARAGTRWLVVA
jgi:hypothetical protein